LTKHSADVDLRPNGEYFISTYSYDGFLEVLDGPPVVLAPEATPEEIGAETVAALLRSGTIVSPLNTGGTPPDHDLLARAGAKTYGAYMKGTKSVGVFADFDGTTPDEIKLTPYENKGPRTGYVSIRDKVVTAAYSTDETLGNLLKTALDVATT
jgi:hypothetical protein